MNPIKFTARALRRLALIASQDETRPHICALRFRPSDVIATNGTILVRVPLPHDPERDFVLPSVPTLKALETLGRHRHATVRLTRGDAEARLSAGLGYDFTIGDHKDISVDRYPGVESVIDESHEVGEVHDVHLSASMWIRVGQLARDLMPDGVFSGQDIPYSPADAPIRIVKAGKINANVSVFQPAHIAFKTEHGDALAVVMPVRR